ncbi:MAG: PHB depolymerase family esterase [Brevefilum sp.]|nr:PHB depolymerase family esterase [Brevefilum sp.]MDW7755704.1 PHB depolymerase family esterase [Brevefilum sp.]
MKKYFRFLAYFLFVLVLLFVIAITLWLALNRTNGKIVSGGETRRYLLYVPESYDPSEPTPLVINIHGFAQWPANQMRVSQWNELADEEGFIVVYPSGTGFPLRWRVSEDSAYPGGQENEIAFISDLIDKLSDEFNIDSARVYANGLSNGGGMSLLLACELSDRITAVGGVAGAYLFDLENCHPQRLVPAIFFHGKADQIVPFNGSPSERFELLFSKISEFVHSYAQKNACDLNPQTVMNTANVRGIYYSGCRENADIHFYSIEDGGHTWPGGSPLPERITGKTSQEIDATQLMWEFFQEFSIDD